MQFLPTGSRCPFCCRFGHFRGFGDVFLNEIKMEAEVNVPLFWAFLRFPRIRQETVAHQLRYLVRSLTCKEVCFPHGSKVPLNHPIGFALSAAVLRPDLCFFFRGVTRGCHGALIPGIVGYLPRIVGCAGGALAPDGWERSGWGLEWAALGTDGRRWRG